MNYLSKLIDERSRDLDIQFSRARKVTPDELVWIQAKKAVDDLSTSFEQVLKERLRLSEKFVRKYQGRNKNTIYVDLEPINGFELQLIIYEGSETKAEYVLYNEQIAMVYIRDLW